MQGKHNSSRRGKRTGSGGGGDGVEGRLIELLDVKSSSVEREYCGESRAWDNGKAGLKPSSNNGKIMAEEGAQNELS